MKKRILTVIIVLGLCVGTASAQFGFGGIVYDPTNYANAVLRYNQLVAGGPVAGAQSGFCHACGIVGLRIPPL